MLAIIRCFLSLSCFLTGFQASSLSGLLPVSRREEDDTKATIIFSCSPCSACHSPVLISSALCLQVQVILAECVCISFSERKGEMSCLSEQSSVVASSANRERGRLWVPCRSFMCVGGMLEETT